MPSSFGSYRHADPRGSVVERVASIGVGARLTINQTVDVIGQLVCMSSETLKASDGDCCT